MNNETIKEIDLRALVTAFSFGLGLTVYLLTPFNINAWSIIDDHEILGWIGDRSRLPPGEYFSTLASTEVGDPSKTNRFRPVYYGLRLATAMVWGKNVTGWYATHALILLLSIAGVVYALLRFVSRRAIESLAMLCFVALVYSRIQWADTFARLGPAEAYAALGFAICLVGLSARYFDNQRAPWVYAAIALGAVIAAGSKENFLFMLPLVIFACIRDGRSARAGMLWLVVSALIMLGQAVVVYRYTMTAGADIYGTSTDLGARVQLLWQFATQPVVAGLLVVAIAAIWTVLVPRFAVGGANHKAVAPLLWASLIALALIGVAATQFFFYAGKLPAGSRYDFPYRTVLDLAGLTLLLGVHRALAEALPSHGKTLATALIAAALLAALAAYPGLKSVRADVAWIRQGNINFESHFKHALTRIREANAERVVLTVHRGIDYEPVHSIATHLRAAGFRGVINVQVAGDVRVESAWEEGLLRQVKTWAEMGRSKLIDPAEAASDKACFGFGLSGPPTTSCVDGVTIWPIKIE